MLNKVMIGRYYSIPSFIHRMNPIAKVLCLILFLIMMMLTNDIRYNVVLMILLFLIILSTKIPLILYGKTIWGMKWFLLLILLINIIFGTTLQTTCITILRVIYIILYSTVLTLTTPPSEITYALEKILSPLKLLKIPVSRIALVLTLTLRFIPTIIDTGNQILKSQASRGIDYYQSNFKGKFLAVKSLLIPSFSIAFKKADKLLNAMEIRLYNTSSKRTNFRQNGWGIYDTFLVLMHLSLFILIVVKGVIV